MLCKWDCSKDSSNTKFPHLKVYKLKRKKWGTAFSDFCLSGGPPVHPNGLDRYLVRLALRSFWKGQNLKLWHYINQKTASECLHIGGKVGIEIELNRVRWKIKWKWRDLNPDIGPGGQSAIHYFMDSDVWQSRVWWYTIKIFLQETDKNNLTPPNRQGSKH